MAVQRSPSKSATSLLLTPIIANTHSNSDSAIDKITNTDKDSQYFNITKRQKRTFDDSLTQTSPTGLTSILTEIKDQQDKKFELLNIAINTIMSQNQEIKNSVQDLTKQHHELMSKITSIEQDNCDLKNRVETLENKLDYLENNTRSTCVEIRNLPKKSAEYECKQDLISITQNLGKSLSLETDIQPSEIKDIYRSKTAAIVVDFTTTHRKESLISNYKKLNKSRRENKEPQLNSEQLGFPGPPQAIFMSESLTSKAKRIFYVAREYVKNQKLAAAWTSYGKVYIKTQEGAKPVRIVEEAQIHELVK